MAPMRGEKLQPLASKHSLAQRPESPRRPSKIVKFNDEEAGQSASSMSKKQMNPNPRLQRYLIAIEYIGTRFAGAQQQSNCRTVVGVLEEAFKKFIGQPVSIFCSSRTDAGVHALSNVCHVDVERISKRKPDEVLPPHEPEVVKRAVNHFLQKNEGDVTIIDVCSVAADFHARYKAQERKYFYRILCGPEPLSTFEKDRAWHVPEELDLLAMQQACRVLVGHHDFSSFRAAACQAKSPIRSLDELSVTEVASTPYFPSILEMYPSDAVMSDLPETLNSKTLEGRNEFGVRRRHRCLVVTARARSFLYHQVRLLVGVLKAVGSGDLGVPDVERILNAKTVTAASPMAPSSGLYLGHVRYDVEDLKNSPS
ncbi:unnamed protein product [Cuscuta epithymum]|uniref:tRNA pseudouridine synthase n=1 Tax=Cuscuta epithymum TaxID=186058 RepID=A0AAV0EIK0_9ASTE|nr:unnamed protein product [Cuscuta epithymum]CAH9121889.1 unnamed protein product [Cuscuta epithymum]